MSAAFLDYDNDGRLDIYTGNMWSAPGLRITSAPAFMRDAAPEVRALYRRHVRGNSLLRNLGDAVRRRGSPCSNNCCSGIRSMPSPWNCFGNGRGGRVHESMHAI